MVSHGAGEAVTPTREFRVNLLRKIKCARLSAIHCIVHEITVTVIADMQKTMGDDTVYIKLKVAI